MPSKYAYLGPIREKQAKCHQNMPILAPYVKRGQNAIKIYLNGPLVSKQSEMPSKYALTGPISEKGAKCHHNLPIWAP